MLGLGEPQQLQLRNEAIAGMTLADLQTVRQWRGHTAQSTECAVGPRLQRYVRGDGVGNVSVRSIDGDREIARLKGPRGPVRNMRFGPHGRHLAAYYHAGSGTQWWVWDLDRSEAILRVRNVVGTAASDFCPDGRTVAVGLRDRTVQLWDLHSGQQRQSLALGGRRFASALTPKAGDWR